MSKRAAEDSSDGGVALKDGQRQNGDGALDDDSELEDEFESEEEIFEAGADGMPDDAGAAEERRGMWKTPKAFVRISDIHISGQAF